LNITVFLGAPGSGKGTQAKRLSQGHNFRHFSTGDMLRAAMKAGSEVGKKAKSFVDKGDLVPDAVMIELIEDALSHLPSDTKVILDGFPRTVPQAEALDQKKTTAVNVSLYFNVPESDLLTRLTGRRVCEKCTEPYHVETLPPKVEGVCDRCGGRVIQRTDDGAAVVGHRLQVFYKQTQPLLDHYRKTNRLKELDGNRPIDTLQKELVQLLH